MDLLLPPQQGSVNSVRILILLASATLGRTGGTPLDRGSRCRAGRQVPRNVARPEASAAMHRAGASCPFVLSVPAVPLRPACTWHPLSGRTGSGVAQGCGPGRGQLKNPFRPAERRLSLPSVPLDKPGLPPQQGHGRGSMPSPCRQVTRAASPWHSADHDCRAPSGRRPEPVKCPEHGAFPLSRVDSSRPPQMLLAL